MKNYLYLLLAGIVALTACGGGSGSSQSADSTQTASERAAEAESKYDKYVCTTAPLAMRKAPERKDGSNYITGLNLGEVVSYTGDEVLDSASKTTFAKVIASDGTEGWVIANYVVPMKNLCVSNSNAEVYLRPQLVTKVKSKMLYMGDLFVKQDEKDGFTQVTALKDQKVYWIVTPISYLTSENDVTLALNVTNKKLLVNGQVADMTKFTDFITESEPFADTELYQLLKAKIPVMSITNGEGDMSEETGNNMHEVIEE